jgi:hypothetical protein
VVLFQLERSLFDYIRAGRGSLERSLFGYIVQSVILLERSLWLAVYLSVCLAVWPSVCLAVWPSVWLAVWPSVWLAVWPSVWLAVWPSVCLQSVSRRYLSISEVSSFSSSVHGPPASSSISQGFFASHHAAGHIQALACSVPPYEQLYNAAKASSKCCGFADR